MKTIILSFTILFLFIIKSQSQSFAWVHLNDLDYAFNPSMVTYTTCSDPSGGAYFFGIKEHVTFYNQSMGDLFLEKYNADGEKAWSRTIFGESNVSGINCDQDGNVFFYGQMLQNTNFWGEDSLVKTGIGTDAFLSKANSQGELEWCINLTSLPYGEGTAENVAFDEQGRLYVAYSTWLNSYIMIMSPSGELINTIVQQNVNLVSGLDIDAEGNIIAAGSCAGWNAEFNGESHPAPFSYTTYIVKYNSSYQPEWVKYIEDFTCTFPLAKFDGAGGIYFAGPLLAQTAFDDIIVNGPAWSYDYFLAYLNAGGQYQWVRECPEVLTGDATVGSLHFLDNDEDGNALLAGITRGVIDWGNGIISDVTGNYQDIMIWSYNKDGMINWIKTAGGIGFDLVHSITSGPGGAAYLAGIITDDAEFDTIEVAPTGTTNPYLAKLEYDVVAGLNDGESRDEVVIYPNPASAGVNIKAGREYSVYRIYDINGHEILNGKVSAGDFKLEFPGLSCGLYILSLETENGIKNNVPLLVK